MSIGFWQIAIVVILVVLLFGRGKISSLMGDVAKGIKSFKKGMASDVNEDISSNESNSEPKNVSENNQDSTNSDVNEDISSNESNSEPKNISENNQDSSNKE